MRRTVVLTCRVAVVRSSWIRSGLLALRWGEEGGGGAASSPAGVAVVAGGLQSEMIE